MDPFNEKALAKEVMLSPYRLLDLTQQSDQELAVLMVWNDGFSVKAYP